MTKHQPSQLCGVGVLASIAASVMGLVSPQRSLLAEAQAAPTSVIPTKTEGVPGGGNFGGRILFEPNVELRESAGYGRAGTYEVGQWQLIALSNPYVSMAMDHVLRPVAGARVDIEPPPEASIGSGPGKVSKADADQHTAFLQWALTEHFQLGRLSKVAASGALLSGFALFEPLAEEVLCPVVPGRTVWALKDAVQCLPNSLDPSSPWRVDETGRLVGIGQQGPVGMGGKWLRTVLPAERALLMSWKREAGNFAGQSQLRTCWYLAAKVMPQLTKMIGVTLQREGPGIPQAVATDKTAKLSPEQRQELIEIYANMSAHESSGLVMPAGWQTEWTVSPAANKGHIIDVIEKMGIWILQQFGAQQLVIGTGKTGALSSGEMHDARSMAMVSEVLTFLAENYNGARGEADGLVKRLIDWNFGPQPVYPKVKLTAQRPELSPTDLATALKAGKEAGVFTATLKDQNDFRDRAGLAPITEEELAKEREEAAARAPQMPGQESGHGAEGEPPTPKGSAMKQPLSASAPRVPWTPSRPLRASEQKTDWKGIDAFLTDARDRYDSRVKPVVIAMMGVAAPAIDRAMADGKVTPAEVAAIHLDTKRLTLVINEFVQGVRKAGASFLRSEVAAGPITAVADDEDETAVLEADHVANAQVSALVRRVENRVRGEIEREAIDVMRTGGTAQEVVSRAISRQIDSGAFKADAGTVTTKAFNVGRDEAARIMGGIASVEYSAVLDSATCDPCQQMDGRTAPFDSAAHDDMLPPNRDCAGGDNCRCVLIMIPGDGGDE